MISTSAAKPIMCFLGYFWQSGQIFWVMAEIGIYLENMALITHKCPGKSAQIGSANAQSRFS